MVKKKIIYLEVYHNCCENGNYLSQDELLKKNMTVGVLYLADEDADLSKIYGDDWNDAPACCNAGIPYPETVKGFLAIELKLGKNITL